MDDYTKPTVSITEVVNGGEAVHVTAEVTRGKTTRVIKGSFNSLSKDDIIVWFEQQYDLPVVVEKPSEKVEKVEEPAPSAYVLDPVRVAKCAQLEASYKTLVKVGKLEEQVEVRK